MTIVFVPALIAVLVAKEREIGHELTQEEVELIRDSATAIELPEEIAEDMAKERGYPDIDPEDVWSEWLAYKATRSA